ncbi:MAG: hypothetical protein PHQ36_08520 [Anaerolineales bacterium]|nr:hypothetical protein [Anaerolineales bacterium]
MQETLETRQNTLEHEKRAKNAFSVSAAVGVIFILIAASAMLVNRSARLSPSLSLILLTAVVSLIGAWLSRRGKSDLGVLLTIATLIVTIFGRVFIQQGLSIPTGITSIILISTIAVYALSPDWAGRAIVISFFAVVATIIIDQYTKNIPPSSAPERAMNVALILGAVYLIILASQFSRFRLRAKLITGFLFLSATPLIMLGWQTYITSQTILQNQVKANLAQSAASISGIFADFVNEQIGTLSTEASLADIVDYVSLPEANRKDLE